MGRRLTFGVILLLVLLAVAPLGASDPVDAQSSTAQPEVDNTITRIQLYANGSARWSIQVRTRLETDEEVEQFEQFQDRIRQNESEILTSFRDRMTGVVKTAANTTGRPMAARNFDVSTRIQAVPQRWGIVQYEFVWRAFAASEQDLLLVGDVFEGGFFLAEEDRLVLVPPPRYRISNSTPQPDSTRDGAVSWTGRRDFPDKQPAVVVEPVPKTTVAEVGSPATGELAGQATQEHPLVPGLFDKWPEAVLVAAVILVVLLMKRRGIWTPSENSGTSKPHRTGASSVGVQTDEDQIRSLLREHGGELRQSAIAERFGWSASKTSRLLSDMAEAGEIEQIRIGRENIIRLPDNDEEKDS